MIEKKENHMLQNFSHVSGCIKEIREMYTSADITILFSALVNHWKEMS